MAYFPSEKKFKEADDLSATFRLLDAWEETANVLADFTMHSVDPKRKRAIAYFLAFFNLTFAELRHRSLTVSDKFKRSNITSISNDQADKLCNLWDEYTQALLTSGIITIQKLKDSDLGGH